MTAIGSVTTPAAQAVTAGQANTATGASQTQAAPSGLPPANLAPAASLNTLNAELATSQWGVDPASVGGVYGGAAQDGGLFSSLSLLPVLSTLTHANAEQALTLMGVQTPATDAGSGASTSSTPTSSTTSPSSTEAAAKPTASALNQAAAGSSAPMVVDPLWGRTA
jgi:hypothetical protein